MFTTFERWEFDPIIFDPIIFFGVELGAFCNDGARDQRGAHNVLQQELQVRLPQVHVKCAQVKASLGRYVLLKHARERLVDCAKKGTPLRALVIGEAAGEHANGSCVGMRPASGIGRGEWQCGVAQRVRDAARIALQPGAPRA